MWFNDSKGNVHFVYSQNDYNNPWINNLRGCCAVDGVHGVPSLCAIAQALC
jgi:hypothetical protein